VRAQSHDVFNHRDLPGFNSLLYSPILAGFLLVLCSLRRKCMVGFRKSPHLGMVLVNVGTYQEGIARFTGTFLVPSANI
jgi:hypothetical protein